MANNRSKRNMIGAIKAQDSIIEDPSLIKEAVVNHFSSIFREGPQAESSMGGFEAKEIIAAIKDCHSSKAPGLDGFNFNFIKKGWNFMKDDLIHFFNDFHSNSKLVKVLPNLIGETQSAFIGGKQILDGVLMTNEIIHHWKKQQSGGPILELNFEKASDCVNWKFLIDMLKNLGCALNILLERARACRMIRGVKVGRNGLTVITRKFA
ncbi:uncharacterized protein LOC131317053 [Rhododendron vialii]|uniref:uncharacterized protein LOC131317053 n=1 Tax=Rhododendron vialii TaxID=182163 RepID=UPI00265DF9F4|nr:uncharacterized protein LOC131317053 [Rhododendron vialii]